MSTDPGDDTSSEAAAPAKSRKPWIWLSALLAIVAAGLLIWALTLRSDLDSTQDEAASTQQELASTEKELDSTQKELDTTQQDVTELESERDGHLLTGAALLSAKSLYDEVAEELDATNEDLAATQQDLEEADKQAKQAEQDAKEAKQAAANADSETEKAQAEADQATADVEAAQSKAAVAADCAKAYISAFGALFEGDSPEDQAPAVRKQLSSITATCKDELAGT
jgi:chromosome segregation ATPase